MRHVQRRVLVFLAGAITIAACVVAQPVRDAKPEWRVADMPTAIQQYMDAFNAHDPEAVGKTLAADVSWMSISGDKMSVDGTGRDAVVTWLRGYFKSFPDVRTLVIAKPALLEGTDFAAGRFFALREAPSWTGKDGKPRTQCSWAMFELSDDGLIQRVWYHATEKPR
jgi:hypothetical protein